MINFPLRKYNIKNYSPSDSPYELYSVVRIASGAASGQYMVSIVDDNNTDPTSVSSSGSISGYWMNYEDPHLNFSDVWKPTYQTSAEFQPSVISFQFGDGYKQVSANGLNHNMTNFDINFEGIDGKEVKSILTYLEYKGGVQQFLYTPPEPFDAENTFVCPNWNFTHIGYNRYTLTCTFEESAKKEIQ